MLFRSFFLLSLFAAAATPVSAQGTREVPQSYTGDWGTDAQIFGPGVSTFPTWTLRTQILVTQTHMGNSPLNIRDIRIALDNSAIGFDCNWLKVNLATVTQTTFTSGQWITPEVWTTVVDTEQHTVIAVPGGSGTGAPTGYTSLGMHPAAGYDYVPGSTPQKSLLIEIWVNRKLESNDKLHRITAPTALATMPSIRASRPAGGSWTSIIAGNTPGLQFILGSCGSNCADGAVAIGKGCGSPIPTMTISPKPFNKNTALSFNLATGLANKACFVRLGLDTRQSTGFPVLINPIVSGCYVYFKSVWTPTGTTDGAGNASISMLLSPATLGLTGVPFYAQAFVLDPSTTLGATSSSYLRIQVF